MSFTFLKLARQMSKARGEDIFGRKAFVPLVSCAKCGRSVATPAAVLDAGTGPEEGSTFTYCSQACMEAH